MSGFDDLRVFDALAVSRLGGFSYLATPYAKYPHGREAAWRHACEVAGPLISGGLSLFSPIAHSHPIDARLSHDMWLRFDRPMMDAAVALIVAKLDGWQDSVGVLHEIDVFRAAGKPLFGLDWPVGVDR